MSTQIKQATFYFHPQGWTWKADSLCLWYHV